MKTQFSEPSEIYKLYHEDDRKSADLSFEQKIRRLVKLQQIRKGFHPDSFCWTCFDDTEEIDQQSDSNCSNS
ncbi:hypothetical protein L0222_09495 [bacterium]|nr:hypothetical protein [bacterium]MCI0603084.1 hypothetical protein [bacterium]